MTKDTFRFTRTRSIEDWLDISETVMRIYGAKTGHINYYLAEDLGTKIQSIRFIQKSCRLFNVSYSYRDDRPLYHYELSGLRLTQLRILDPDFIASLSTSTERLLA